MKKIILFSLALAAIATTAQAQFYGTSSANRAGRLSIHIGMDNQLSGAKFYTSASYTPTEVSPSDLKYNSGIMFGLDLASQNELTESFKLGAMLGFDFAKSSLTADFTAGKYDIKANVFDFHLGLDGEIVVAEKIGIDFTLAPYFQFQFGDKYQSKIGSVTSDWEEPSKDDMAMPNMDLGVLGRVGCTYHFTEMFGAGVIAQYRMPSFNPNDGNDHIKDGLRGLGYGGYYMQTKRKSWSIMAVLTIDFM